MIKVDERDTMFARASYKKGTSSYEDYYANNPDKKDIDDSIRSRPNLCEKGTTTYSEINSPMASCAFHFLSDIKHLCEGEASPNKVEVNKTEISLKLKEFAKHYGASVVGITKLKDYHFYSHRGRHEENYGYEINLDHKYAIVFGCEMDKDMINRAPLVCEVIETSKCYVDAAVVGMVLSYYLRSLGYEARNHMDANYLLMPVLVAKDAGLGDIGRNTILTNKDYGSRLRLGVVTTNLELDSDEFEDFGLEQFCNMCKKCAFNCPSQSLSKDFKFNKDNEFNWIINQESCYTKWRYLGTDCGMCISACPFSQNLDSIKNTKSFKNDPYAVKNALMEYKDKFGQRVFVPGNPDWLK